MPPPKKADPPHKMTLTTNSLRNTTFAVDNDVLYYEVVTRFWHPHVTKINKHDPESTEVETIAELEREPGKEPRLRFGKDGEWMSADSWLKKDGQKIGGEFASRSGLRYRWKSHKRTLQLIRADTEDKTPLVVLHPHKRHFLVFRMSQHAFLEIKPEVVESLDALIMSYLLVERDRRDKRIIPFNNI